MSDWRQHAPARQVAGRTRPSSSGLRRPGGSLSGRRLARRLHNISCRHRAHVSRLVRANGNGGGRRMDPPRKCCFHRAEVPGWASSAAPGRPGGCGRGPLPGFRPGDLRRAAPRASGVAPGSHSGRSVRHLGRGRYLDGRAVSRGGAPSGTTSWPPTRARSWSSGRSPGSCGARSTSCSPRMERAEISSGGSSRSTATRSWWVRRTPARMPEPPRPGPCTSTSVPRSGRAGSSSRSSRRRTAPMGTTSARPWPSTATRS